MQPHLIPKEAEHLKPEYYELYTMEYVERAIDRLKVQIAESEVDLRPIYRLYLLKWCNWRKVLQGTMTLEAYNEKYPPTNIFSDAD